MAKQTFSYDSIQDKHSVQKYLKSLIRSLDRGQISLSSEDGSIELTPGELLHFSMEARKKGRKNKITLELRWTEKGSFENNGDDESKPAKMKISS